MKSFVRTLSLVFILALALYVAAIVFAYWPGYESSPAEELALPGDRFYSSGELLIRYRTFGERRVGRPEIVLAHGFANNLESFRSLAGLLEDCCYVVVLDLPGFGLSSKPIGYDYSSQNQARIVVDLARALELSSPVYGGHSMGGAIALHAGSLDPRASALILLDPGIYATSRASRSLPKLFPFPRLAAKLFGSRATRVSFLRASYHDQSVITEESIDRLMLASRTDDYLSGMTDLLANNNPTSEERFLPELDLPVLSIWGEFDRNQPSGAPYQLQKALPGSQLYIVRDAGHYAHEEKALEVSNVVKDALQRWFADPARDSAELSALSR